MKVLNGNTKGETAATNNFKTAVKQCLLLIIAACILGWTLNFPLFLKSFNGGLLAEIHKKQLDDLKAKAEQFSPGIRFVDLVTAKKLYDDRQAVFLDARSSAEYLASSIAGSVGISLMSVVKGEVAIERLLNDKEKIIVTFCSGGECDVGVEMAKELLGRGYKNVYVLGEGYPGWEMAGYPVFKPDQGVK